MKRFILRYLACLSSATAVLFLAVWFQSYYWADRLETFSPLLILWPGILAAVSDLTHTWLLSALLWFGIPAYVIYIKRNSKYVIQCLMGVLFAGIYLAGAALTSKSVPLIADIQDSNPYPVDSDKHAAFGEAFIYGYKVGMSGGRMSFCFRPEEATLGFYTGHMFGEKRFRACMGIASTRPSAISHHAGIDGVVLTPDP